MKRTILITFALILAAVVSVNFVQFQQEEEIIKELITEGYIHGAFNELNPEAMKKAFHKDFAIFSPGRNGEIRRYPIANWIENTKSTKESDDFNPDTNVWEYSFESVDVSGNSAAVKLELFHEKKHVYTDYLSLLKFEEGWKIVAKVYHQH